MTTIDEGNSVVGTKFKLNINMEPIGDYHLADLEWEARVFATGIRSATISKSAARMVDKDNYIIPVDSREIGPGGYYVTLYVRVPDGDFPDGVRTEVKTMPTGVTIDAK